MPQILCEVLLFIINKCYRKSETDSHREKAKQILKEEIGTNRNKNWCPNMGEKEIHFNILSFFNVLKY